MAAIRGTFKGATVAIDSTTVDLISAEGGKKESETIQQGYADGTKDTQTTYTGYSDLVITCAYDASVESSLGAKQDAGTEVAITEACTAAGYSKSWTGICAGIEVSKRSTEDYALMTITITNVQPSS